MSTARLDRALPTCPVPFRLDVKHHETGDQFWEFHRSRSRESLLLAVCLLMLPALFAGVEAWIALSGLHVASAPDWRVVAPFLGLGIAGLAALAWWVWDRKSATFLLFDPRTDSLSMHGVRWPGRDKVLAKLSLGECRMMTQPVAIRYLNNPPLDWHGFALVVWLGQTRFALACDKHREELDRIRAEMPEWLRSVDRGVGPELRTFGSIDLGHRPTGTNQSSASPPSISRAQPPGARGR